MQSLTITATLNTPVIAQGWLTLDALLMHELKRDDISDILRCDDGLYYASAMQLEQAGTHLKAQFVASMRPQHTPQWLDIIQPNTRDKDVAIGDSRASEGGNVISSYSATPAKAAVWHATGDRQRIAEILRDLRFIGKKRNQGYGEVIRWKFSDGDIDGLQHDGQPLRPIPADRWKHGGNPVLMDASWRPAYWDINNRAKCVVPFKGN